MIVDRTMVDSGELRHAATLVRQNENAARDVAGVVRGVDIELPPDDPMRTTATSWPRSPSSHVRGGARSSTSPMPPPTS